jgi:DNA-binding transcriptional regulator PaaX
MSLQAELAVDLLMAFYAELDQRSGWVSRAAVIKLFRRDGIGEGRIESALATLLKLQMLNMQTSEAGTIEYQLSTWGVTWFEENYTLVQRGKRYEYEKRRFGKVILRGPSSSANQRATSSTIHWEKWGAVAGIVAIPLAILIWWLS